MKGGPQRRRIDVGQAHPLRNGVSHGKLVHLAQLIQRGNLARIRVKHGTRPDLVPRHPCGYPRLALPLANRANLHHSGAPQIRHPVGGSAATPIADLARGLEIHRERDGDFLIRHLKNVAQSAVPRARSRRGCWRTRFLGVQSGDEQRHAMLAVHSHRAGTPPRHPRNNAATGQKIIDAHLVHVGTGARALALDVALTALGSGLILAVRRIVIGDRGAAVLCIF